MQVIGADEPLCFTIVKTSSVHSLRGNKAMCRVGAKSSGWREPAARQPRASVESAEKRNRAADTMIKWRLLQMTGDPEK